MSRKLIFTFIAGLIVGSVCTFFFTRSICNRPIVESVTRDTVTLYDTIVQYAPKPVSVEKVRTEYKWLPVVRTDTVTRTDYIAYHDTALVEVPITSKHYQSPEYDAWVSGYEPSLDSIKVYQKETLITERVVVSKPPNRLSLDVEAGADYMTTQKDMTTFAFGELTYKIRDSRFAIGLRGGIIKPPADKAELFVGGVVKLRIF